jgi:hypothetical protein
LNQEDDSLLPRSIVRIIDSGMGEPAAPKPAARAIRCGRQPRSGSGFGWACAITSSATFECANAAPARILRGDPDRFHQLVLGGALFDGELGVAADAVRALSHVRDRHAISSFVFAGSAPSAKTRWLNARTPLACPARVPGASAQALSTVPDTCRVAWRLFLSVRFDRWAKTVRCGHQRWNSTRDTADAQSVTGWPVALAIERGTSSVALAAGTARNMEKRQFNATPRVLSHGSEYTGRRLRAERLHACQPAVFQSSSRTRPRGASSSIRPPRCLHQSRPLVAAIEIVGPATRASC